MYHIAVEVRSLSFTLLDLTKNHMDGIDFMFICMTEYTIHTYGIISYTTCIKLKEKKE